MHYKFSVYCSKIILAKSKSSKSRIITKLLCLWRLSQKNIIFGAVFLAIELSLSDAKSVRVNEKWETFHSCPPSSCIYGTCMAAEIILWLWLTWKMCLL